MQILRKLGKMALSIALVFFVLEIGATVYCKSRGITRDFIAFVGETSMVENGLVLHPYLGFTTIRRVGEPDELSRQTPPQESVLTKAFNERLPLERGPNDLIIGILGNSVAESFNNTQLQRLKAKLLAGIPALRSKNLRFQNLALYAYKQPQQMIQSVLRSDYFDAVIQLDGFNEVAHPLFPDRPVMYPILGPDYRQIYSDTSLYFWLMAQTLQRRYIHWLHQSVWGHSHLAILVAHLARAKFMASPTGPQAISPEGPALERMAEERVRQWSKNLRAQNGALRALGKPVWFFVQPNPHFNGSKPLSPQEIEMNKQGAGFDRDTDVGYPLLVAEASRLRRQGLPVHDLSRIFQNVRETTFNDGCCHLNQYGVQLVTDAIAEVLVREWPQDPLAIQLSRSHPAALQ